MLAQIKDFFTKKKPCMINIEKLICKSYFTLSQFPGHTPVTETVDLNIYQFWIIGRGYISK